MIRFLFLIVFGFILITVYIKYIENKGIFFPIKEISIYPSAINLHFDDVYIKTKDDITINGWFIPHTNARYTLLFLHGNAGNIGHRLEKLKMLWDIGINIFIIDYRGYGKNGGSPSERGFYLDADAAYSYLVNGQKIQPDRIILYGESLGTAVAVDLASRVKVRALILEGAFSSGRDFGKKIYPFLPYCLFSNKFNSLEKIKNVNVPKLFIHSKDDEIVPFELAKKLYNLAWEPKYFEELTGGHNEAFLDSKEGYVLSISSFLEKL